jgi:hypothetical protein
MYTVEHHMTEQIFRIVQATAVAMLVGWLVERALDTGFRVRGLGLLAGLVGLYAGAWIWAVGGWGHGPMFGELALGPTIAGAFAVCGFLKLVGLGLAGPRW